MEAAQARLLHSGGRQTGSYPDEVGDSGRSSRDFLLSILSLNPRASPVQGRSCPAAAARGISACAGRLSPARRRTTHGRSIGQSFRRCPRRDIMSFDPFQRAATPAIDSRSPHRPRDRASRTGTTARSRAGISAVPAPTGRLPNGARVPGGPAAWSSGMLTSCSWRLHDLRLRRTRRDLPEKQREMHGPNRSRSQDGSTTWSNRATRTSDIMQIGPGDQHRPDDLQYHLTPACASSAASACFSSAVTAWSCSPLSSADPLRLWLLAAVASARSPESGRSSCCCKSDIRTPSGERQRSPKDVIRGFARR